MTTTNSRDIAAIDLGSNSFHMVVARVVDEDLQLISRHKQRVHLADGLDHEMNLSHSAMERGLECLAMFAERLQGFDPDNVRIAATHTLRQARNAHLFLQRAKQVLPFPIEIIPGEEEARLIYLGVAHTQLEVSSKLVVDIGGGSTELIIGNDFEPELLNSKQMGCVNFTSRFFANGKITKKNINKAITACEQKLESIASSYRKKGWQIAYGSSGSIKAIREVLIGIGFEDGLITLNRLSTLIEMLCSFDSIDDIQLQGLSDERKPVFTAGVAILTAIFQTLKLSEMHYSDGALREGLLYEMESGFARSDLRMRTTENLAKKHLVDLEHAARVKGLASDLLEQTHKALGIKRDSELANLLQWAALLHEVGLSISLRGFHRHTAYILQHTNMPGFNSEQQLLLASLTRYQRKSLKLTELPDFHLYSREQVINLIRLLRLAILINGQRNDDPLPEFTLEVNHDHWSLKGKEKDWLENNKLLSADLQSEQERWSQVNWKLELT